MTTEMRFRPNDSAIRNDVIKLVQYAREMAASTGTDVIDLAKFEHCWWLSELPSGVEFRTAPAVDDSLLRIPYVRIPSPPAVPDGWLERVDLAMWSDSSAENRDIATTVEAGEIPSGEADSQQWLRALAARQRWLDSLADVRSRRALSEAFRSIARRLAAEDDEYELVLSAGLVVGRGSHGKAIRRHLLTKRLRVRIDSKSSSIAVGVDRDSRLRLEDRRFLASAVGDRLEMVDALRAEIEASDVLPHEAATHGWLSLWADRVFPESAAFDPTGSPPANEDVSSPQVFAAPAMIFRRRDRSSIVSFYDQMLQQLNSGDGAIPLGLVQLLRTPNHAEQTAWLEAIGAPRGDLLGDDPLFFKPSNQEQRLVLERVRYDNGAVVQGPPGTGKTHTIANLIGALLAKGLRVLVVSQREQPLRVLRGKLPKDMQNLCVALTGSSRRGGSELEGGVRALSTFVVGAQDGGLGRDVQRQETRRNAAIAKVAELEAELDGLQRIEHIEYQPPAIGYEGRLAQIAELVVERREQYRWLPSLPPAAPNSCPLSEEELRDLRQLIIAHPDGAVRSAELVPEANFMDSVEVIEATIAELTRPAPNGDVSTRADALAGLPTSELAEWNTLVQGIIALVEHLDTAANHGQPWLADAVSDLLGNRKTAVWNEVFETAGKGASLEAGLRNPAHAAVFIKPHPQPQRRVGWRVLLGQAVLLQKGLAKGEALWSKYLKIPTELAKATADLRQEYGCAGRELDTFEAAEVMRDFLSVRAQIEELDCLWREATSTVPSPDADPFVLIETITAAEQYVNHLCQLASKIAAIRTGINSVGILVVLTSRETWCQFADAVSAAEHRRHDAERRRQYQAIVEAWHRQAEQYGAAPEVKAVWEALEAQDVERYRAAAECLVRTRMEIAAHRRHRDLLERLRRAHPQLAEAVSATAGDAEWEDRIPQMAAGWAWAIAERFVRDAHQPGRFAQREADLSAAKAEQLAATAALASALAMSVCLSRMNRDQQRALENFGYWTKKSEGGSKYKAEYRRSARTAMRTAKEAVPAWIMPITRVAEFFHATPNCFDVVVVDEASQAGMTSLFLLWLAPRMIVVGDDKQCTPLSTPHKIEDVQRRLGSDFPHIESHIRELLLPNGNLYNMLTGAFSAIRLREHFRCMPEIIGWPSKEFYEKDLVPLRQYGTDRLAPVVFDWVDGATDPLSDKVINRIEAEKVVEVIADCIDDPAYQGKSIGVVVLQSQHQCRLIEHLLLERIPAEEIDRREIAVGPPPDFQGDERAVIIVTTVVAGEVRQMLKSVRYQQYLNVAVSRAQDQLRIVTSLRPTDLVADDLRNRMLKHYHDVTEQFGQHQYLDAAEQIPEDLHRAPFRSMFHQRMFRSILAAGYRAEPNVVIGNRRLDIVVRGSSASMAVVCDEHTGYAAEYVAEEAASLRELQRAGWPFHRVSHSQYILDSEKTLAPLWEALAQNKIEKAATIRKGDVETAG